MSWLSKLKKEISIRNAERAVKRLKKQLEKMGYMELLILVEQTLRERQRARVPVETVTTSDDNTSNWGPCAMIDPVDLLLGSEDE